MAGSLFIFAAGCMIIYSATEIEDYVCPNLPGFSPKSKSILFTRSSNETDKCGQFFGRKIVAGVCFCWNFISFIYILLTKVILALISGLFYFKFGHLLCDSGHCVHYKRHLIMVQGIDYLLNVVTFSLNFLPIKSHVS